MYEILQKIILLKLKLGNRREERKQLNIADSRVFEIRLLVPG